MLTVVLTCCGLLLGAAAGIGILMGYQRLRAQSAADEVLSEAPAEAVVPAGVDAVLDVLGQVTVVVGPHDEVLRSSELATRLGLVDRRRVVPGQVLDLVRQVRRDRMHQTIELDHARGRGSAVVDLAIRVAPLDDDLVIVLGEDRTAQRRIEATRRDFVANVSHELKTPIGAIALLSEAVVDAAGDAGAVRHFADRMSVESQRLSDLVVQLIELSRVQALDSMSQPVAVEVDAVLADAMDRTRLDADDLGVELRVAGEISCVVLGNAGQLVTAVTNLVKNAVIYSERGAKVVLAARRRAGPDPHVEITVSDNGIGIAGADLDRIFERFYRVDYARSRANGGTGLGLSIVKHIAAAHGGSIDVWSRPGEGSTFTLRIPDGAPDEAVTDGDTTGRRRSDPAAVSPRTQPDRQTAGTPRQTLEVGS